MKYTSFLIFYLLISIQLWGQESVIQNKITLNTGEVYWGEIVVKTAEMIMIKTETGKRYQFQLAEVTKIEKSLPTETKSSGDKTQIQEINKSGNFCGNIELSGGISSGLNSFPASPNTEFSMIFGNKNISKKDIFWGIGVGYNLIFLSSTNNPVEFIPVFLRMQSLLVKSITAPFIGIDAGYSFGLTPGLGGGPFIKISLGISHKTGIKSDFYGGIYGGLSSISGKVTEINDLGTFTYFGPTSMIDFGAKVGFHF
jgi:hypothetical protein